jgi:hypothetical protein
VIVVAEYTLIIGIDLDSFPFALGFGAQVFALGLQLIVV